MISVPSRRLQFPRFKTIFQKNQKPRYKDVQKVVLQEGPDDAPTGKIPMAVELLVQEDLVDAVRLSMC
jgi:DNA replicative helicase MCM subunit Mcm2 (Cdc46/Mcm family)